MKLTDLINEEKYTIIDPKGNPAGTGTKDQANQRQKKLGGSKKGYFVVPAKKALKARRTLEKYKFDFKNTKLQDMMSDLYFEGTDDSMNEEQINEIGVLGVAGGVALGLVGVIALSKGVGFAKRKFGDAMSVVADKMEKKVKKIESDNAKKAIMDIAKKFENDKKLQGMYQSLPAYKDGGKNSERKKGMAEIAKYVKSKLSSDEMEYFYDLNTYLRTNKIKGTLVAPEKKTAFQKRLDKLGADNAHLSNESVNEVKDGATAIWVGKTTKIDPDGKSVIIKKGDKGEVIRQDHRDQYLVRFGGRMFYAHLNKNFKVDESVNEESVTEGASTEEKRIVMMAIKKIAKYRNVPLDYAVGDVMRAAQELERDIKKGKIK